MNFQRESMEREQDIRRRGMSEGGIKEQWDREESFRRKYLL